MASERDGRGRRTALITGATGGIGMELAQLFARDHMDLVLVARGEGNLGKLAGALSERFGVIVTAVAQDLSKPEAVDSLKAELDERSLAIDVLVNSAGFGVSGPFHETDAAAEAEMLQVNVVTPTRLAKLLLPSMLAAGRGGIINVASTAAFSPGPLMAVYYASKAYMLSFSEALAEEARGSGVTITALCPGPTTTGFQARAGVERTAVGSGALLMEPRAVAIAGYRGFRAGKVVVIPGARNRLLTESVRVMPRAAVRRLVKRVQTPRA